MAEDPTDGVVDEFSSGEESDDPRRVKKPVEISDEKSANALRESYNDTLHYGDNASDSGLSEGATEGEEQGLESPVASEAQGFGAPAENGGQPVGENLGRAEPDSENQGVSAPRSDPEGLGNGPGAARRAGEAGQQPAEFVGRADNMPKVQSDANAAPNDADGQKAGGDPGADRELEDEKAYAAQTGAYRAEAGETPPENLQENPSETPPAGNPNQDEDRSEAEPVEISASSSPPQAVDDLATVDQDSVLSIDVLANDSDPDVSDSLTITAANVMAGDGSVSVVDGELQYDPGSDYNGLADGESAQVTVEYTIDDGNGGTDTATATITVTGSNDGPTAVADTGSVGEDSTVTIDVLANDTDPDISDSLTITVANVTGGNGSVSIVDDELQYDPGSDYNYLADGETAQVTVEYTVDDGNGGTDTSTATITVIGSNDGPTAVADTGSVDEDSTVTIDVLANDSDPDATDSLTITAANVTAGNGSVSIVDGELQYDPGSDYNGLADGESAQVTVEYTIDDGNGGTDTAIATITVTGSNGDPIAVVDTGSVGEDATVTIDVLANDSDADTTDSLTITAANVIGGNGSVSIVSGELEYDPGSDYNYLADGETAQVTVEYTVDDDNGGTDTATATITVTGSNDGPTAEVDTGSTDQGSTVTIDVLANDADPDSSDTLTITSADVVGGFLGGRGTASVVGNQVQYDPGSEYDYLADGETAQVTIVYAVDDGNGGTDSATVTITVTGSNDGPTAVADTGSVGEDSTVTIDVLANDTDTDTSDNLTITAANVTAGDGSVSIVGGELEYDPGSDYNSLADGETAQVTVEYTIDDGNGGTDTATATITVTGSNDGPTAVADIGSVDEDATVTIDVLANDSDADTSDNLTITAANVTAGDGSVSIVEGELQYDPGSDYNYLADGETAQVTVEYTVDDGNGGTDTATATITVTGSNDGPTAVADTGSVAEDATITIDVLANDTDPDTADSLTLTSANVTGGNGSVSIIGGELEYDPGSDYNYLADGETAQVTVEYTVDDGNGGTDTATATITVTGSNDGPTAVADSASVAEDATITIDVLANDTDPDTSDSLTITAANVTGGNGSVSIVSGELEYDPGSDYNYLADGETAQVTVEYTVADGNGGTDTATATITVTGSNDGPTAVADTGSVDEDATVTIDVLANDSDPDTTDSLTITAANVTGGSGSVSIVSGELRYDPGSDYNYLDDGESAQVTIEYTVDDGNGGTDTATTTITVTGSDDGIVGTSGDDVLVGTSDDDVIDGLAGDDTITGADGDDTLSGSSGSDEIFGDAGDDTIDGGAQSDTLHGGDGDDNIIGGSGSDTLYGDAGDDIMDGGAQGDTLHGGDGDDNLSGASGSDTLFGGAGDDIMDGGAQGDTLHGGDGEDDISGSSGNDTLYGDAGDDILDGGANSDTLHGGEGGDTLTGSTGDDTLYGDAGDDTLEGGANSDTLHGGEGSDTLTGDSGSDTLYGDDGDDTLDGGANGDTLTGGAGDDTLVGGTGADTAVYTGPRSEYVITDNGDGTYTIEDTVGGRDGTDIVSDDIESFQFSDGTVAESDILVVPNTAPTAADDTASVGEDATVTIDVLANDTDADTTDNLTITAANVTGGSGSVSIVSGELEYDPGSDYNYLADGESAQVTVEYTIDDGNGGTDTATATITVTGSNDGPTAVADTASVGEGATVTIDVLGNDSDPDTTDNLTITAANVTGGNGSVSIVSGELEYDPGSDYNYLADGESAQVTVEYTVDDGNGGTDTATATITVTGSNDGPTAVADTASVGEDATVTIDVLANDTDADTTDNLTITAANVTGGNGSVSIVSGELEYDPGGNYNYLADGETAQVTVEYTIDDGNGGTDTAIATITVTGSNDGPTAVADTGAVNEASTVTIDVLANDSDPDTTDNLTLTTANITGGNGSVSIVGNELQYDAGTDYDYLADGETAQVTVEYTVDDGNGGTDTATTTITVTGADDAIEGTSGDDEITGTSDADTIMGYDGKDNLEGGDGDDIIYGGAGDDKLYGGENKGKGDDGDDTLHGGDGDDDIKGGEGADTLYGDDGDDKVKGEEGADTLHGGAGDDEVKGGDGDDTMFGDAGDDELKGEDDDDTMSGGDGSDTFVYESGDGSDIIDGGTGGGWTDTIEFESKGKGKNSLDYGDDWTITFDTGGIDSQGSDYLELTEDSSGTITLDDGETIEFEGIERVEW